MKVEAPPTKSPPFPPTLSSCVQYNSRGAILKEGKVWQKRRLKNDNLVGRNEKNCNKTL